MRRRSPPFINNGADSSTEISFGASSSFLPPQKYRSNTQLTDRSTTSHHHRHHHHHRQPKLVRAQSRTHSSSSDERAQVAAISQISSNDTSDDDDPNSFLSQHSRLRRKYVKTRQATPPPPPLSRQQSIREPTLPPTSPTLRYASNGVLLRQKHQPQPQQQHTSSIFQTSSKDMGKKPKRFTLDTVENRWHHPYQIVPNNQPTSEANIYRSSMAIVPSLNANVYGVQINPTVNHNFSTTFKQAHSREEIHNDLHQRPKVIIG